MTKALSPITDQKCPVSLFMQQQVKGDVKPSIGPAVVIRDMLTPYFSIPTASRVHSCFRTHAKQKAKASRTKVERFLSFCFHKVGRALSKFLEDKPPYDTSHIAPPKELLVPGLPEPAFEMHEPQRLFFVLLEPSLREEYAPPCLLREIPPTKAQPLPREKDLVSHIEKELPSQGVLKRDPSGMLYLAIEENSYLPASIPQELLSEIKDQLPSHLMPHPMGTYIPVFLPTEAADARNLGICKEIGREFTFTVTTCSTIETPLLPEVQKAWFLEVESKELTELREKYLLPSKVGGHAFHIVLFLQKREKQETTCKDIFRLNVSCYAA